MNHINAAAPSTLVITFCPNEPTAMANTPCIRFLMGKNITRPPYSPMRFGVNTAQFKPQKTDSMACQIEMGANILVKCCHLKASSTQFTIIKSTTSDMITTTFV